jgi:ABC-type polysaccharide/polyol phosphate export permease
MSYGTYPQYPQGPYPPQQPGGYPVGYPGAYLSAPAPYPLPPRRHSPFGVVSFVLAVMSGLGIFGLVISATVMTMRHSAGQSHTAFNEDSPEAVVVGLVFVLALVGAFIGLGLGIGGLFQSDRKRVFAILGLCLNLLILLGVGALMLLSMAAEQG